MLLFFLPLAIILLVNDSFSLAGCGRTQFVMMKAHNDGCTGVSGSNCNPKQRASDGGLHKWSTHMWILI